MLFRPLPPCLPGCAQGVLEGHGSLLGRHGLPPLQELPAAKANDNEQHDPDDPVAEAFPDRHDLRTRYSSSTSLENSVMVIRRGRRCQHSSACGYHRRAAMASGLACASLHQAGCMPAYSKIAETLWQSRPGSGPATRHHHAMARLPPRSGLHSDAVSTAR